MHSNDSAPRLSAAAPHPLRTLDPAAPLDDLGWLDDAIGDAMVFAIGENAHYNRESYLLRHRLLRYLVERHGFTALAMESGFVEGWRTDAWVRGGADEPAGVLADGMTSLMGHWTEMRELVSWLREHNAAATRPVGWYGIDLSGSNVSLLPALDAVLGYLAEIDPDYAVAAELRQSAAAFAVPSAMSMPQSVAAYQQLEQRQRDALTAGLAALVAQLHAHRLDYRRRGEPEAFERALRAARLAVVLDLNARAMGRGDLDAMFHQRDVAIADTVEWVLRREQRIVLLAHNGHIQRWPSVWPGIGPAPTMGMHLADRLGADYLTLGVSNGTGRTLNTGEDFYTGTLFADLSVPEPDCLDGVLQASAEGPFCVDLRRLSGADEQVLRAVRRQRLGTLYSEISPLDAYDLMVHLPTVTEASPDYAAIARAPKEEQALFVGGVSQV